MCSLIEWATKRERERERERGRQRIGRKEIKKIMKLCVPCWLVAVFCLGGSLELGVCIESKPYSLELSYNHVYIE
jgi:hypothetical protein